MGQPEVYLQFKEGLIDNEGNISNEKNPRIFGNFVSGNLQIWVEQTKIERKQIQKGRLIYMRPFYCSR